MEVTIPAGRKPYQALIGSGLLERAGGEIARMLPGGKRGVVISDTVVAPLFGNQLANSLAAAHLDVFLCPVEAGEASKNLGEVGRVIAEMLQKGLDRHSFVIGLGGGVIGDLSGFVAAIYHRGIPHIQIPTTLLAMVDSSIGGKTGVNTAAGKNLIGAVHQPSLVIDDVDLLKTLPLREFRQGYAEIIKHAIISDAEMFNLLERRSPEEVSDLPGLIKRNVEIKARFVAGDEEDTEGRRALLNFGHTIGHAIERAGDYRQFLHGEAISLGMVAASRISAKRAGLPQKEVTAIEGLLRHFQLPTSLPDDVNRAEIVKGVLSDKKFEKGAVRFIVSPAIGSAHLSSEVTLDDIREAVAEL